jgi:hypothetical protein
MLPMLSVHEVNHTGAAVATTKHRHVRTVCPKGCHVSTDAAKSPLHLRCAVAQGPQYKETVHSSRYHVFIADRSDTKYRPRVNGCGSVCFPLSRFPSKEFASRATVENDFFRSNKNGNPKPTLLSTTLVRKL